MVDWILGDNIGSSREIFVAIAECVGRLDYIVYSPRQHNYWPTALSDNMMVYPTRSLSKLHFLRDAFQLGNRLQQDVGYHLISVADPMGSGLVGYWLKRRYGLSLLITCHSDYYSSLAWRLESPRYWLDYLLSIWLLQRSDRVWAVSQRVAQDVVRLGVPPERVTVLPPIMRTHLFTPGDDALDRYSRGRSLFVGRLIRAKSLPTLLRAVRLLVNNGYDPLLKLVGAGPLRPQLMALTHRLGIESWVEFVGHKPQDELMALYQQSSLFVLPSVYEAFGRVIVEAGLCGLPIVGTRVGGIPELVIEGETGLLVPPRDPAALAKAIATLLDDPALAQRMGREAHRQFQEKWRYESLLTAHVAMLEQA
ncbi:MAG: glycosyltransferase family 4 protein, partial [Anaerolineae bacterium]